MFNNNYFEEHLRTAASVLKSGMEYNYKGNSREAYYRTCDI